MMMGLEHLSYEERLREQKAFSNFYCPINRFQAVRERWK